MRQLDSITERMDIRLSELQERAKGREAWCAAVHGPQRLGHDLATKHVTVKNFRLTTEQPTTLTGLHKGSTDQTDAWRILLGPLVQRVRWAHKEIRPPS